MSGGPALKALALPPEHGGWGFLIEPLFLGLMIAPTRAGAALALAALGGFLARHPLKLVVGDLLRGRVYPRTPWAAGLFLAYGAPAALALGFAVAATPAPLWLPLAAAAGLALVQLSYDARNRGRELPAQILGSVAPGALASAIAVAGGWTLGSALALWLILAARAIASVLYVRARLRLDRGLPHDATPVRAGHLAALLAVGGLAAAGRAPWLAVVAFGALLVRAARGLAEDRRPMRPRALGLQELAFGLLTALVVGLGYAAGL